MKKFEDLENDKATRLFSSFPLTQAASQHVQIKLFITNFTHIQ